MGRNAEISIELITYTLKNLFHIVEKCSFLFVILLFHSIGIAQNTPCSAPVLSLDCGPKQIGSNIAMSASAVPNPNCGNYLGGDAWYRTLVPPTGIIEIKLVSISGGITDLGMALYTAPNCGGPFTLVECSDSSMPYIIEDALPVGTHVYIRIWENGNNQFGTYEIEIIDPNDFFCLIDDAITFNFPADTCMQTTADVQNERGCAWYRNTIDFSQDFDEWMILFLGDNNSGADGMTITFQNDPDGTDACGNAGQGLGARTLENGIAIEVDTYNNGSSNEGGGDYNFDHIAVWETLDGVHTPLVPPVRAKSDGSNVEDNTTHTLRVIWTASLQTMAIFFDNEFRTNITYDFVGNVFGSKNVYWGSTGSTGALSNQQYLCPFIPAFALPVELSQFTAICEGVEHVLEWTTLSETNNSHFLLERSLIGESFETIAQIEGQGNSTDVNDYEWRDVERGDYYYRLKQVDYDGAHEYSSIVYSSCEINEILVYPNPAKADLYIKSNKTELISVEIFDLTGHKRMQCKLNKHLSQLSISDLTPGYYTLKLRSKNDLYIKKFVKM